jgi:hypothetical protein
MPGPLLHLGAKATCPHFSGQVAITASNPRVFVMGILPVVTIADVHAVAGCPFTLPGPKPQPCVTAKFTPAARVFVMGRPAALVQAPPGACFSAEQSPQGPPIINSVQTRVIGM